MIPNSTDTNWFLHVNRFAEHTSWLHGPMKVFANDGIVLFILLLIWGWLYARKQDIQKVAALIWTGLGTLVAVIVNQPLVHHFHENRPYTILPHILVLAHRTGDYGFPSDHATMAGAVTAGLFLVNPVIGVVSLGLSLILAFSRVYIAAHYPFDVLAGLAFGALIVLIGYVVLRKPLLFLLTKLAATPLRPLFTNKPVGASEE